MSESIYLPPRNLGALLIHGFTGSPEEMVPYAEELTKYGIHCLLPRLSGHENVWDSLKGVRYQSWLNDVTEAYKELKKKVEHVIVAGLSLGGTLSMYLAENLGPEDGLVAVMPVNPGSRLTPQQRRRINLARIMPSREQLPVQPYIELTKALDHVTRNLHRIKVPVILFVSDQDELIPYAYQQWVFDRIKTPKAFITLPSEKHVPSPKAAETVVKTSLVLLDLLM
ncbi:alpha/beta fold hydrolase [Coprothermobacteraceae bacterium]|nr:alpha/beta fold hydrolase [Coprothermobacteraceae bacterium]